MVSKAISDMLMLNGFVDIWVAEDGSSALEQFEKRAPTLVLLDLMLPDMDGLEVASGMKKKDPDAKIIAVTAVTKRGLEERCKEAGCLEVVHKPFRMAALMESIEKHIGGP